MDRDLNKVCSICVRGGSKGVPNKNIRELCGVPLIGHSVSQAVSSGLFSEVVVSSDSDEILGIAREFGATRLVKRPDDMASDKAPKLTAIRHCISEVEKQSNQVFDIVVDLDATSPLRITSDIAGSIGLLSKSGATNIITGAPARRSPYFNLVEVDTNGVASLSKPSQKAEIDRRQDSPECFDMNASIYVWWRDVLFDNDALFLDGTLLFEMPEERSMDIDSELDFELVEFLMKRANEQK